MMQYTHHDEDTEKNSDLAAEMIRQNAEYNWTN